MLGVGSGASAIVNELRMRETLLKEVASLRELASHLIEMFLFLKLDDVVALLPEKPPMLLLRFLDYGTSEPKLQLRSGIMLLFLLKMSEQDDKRWSGR